MFWTVGCIYGASSVILGAFGAHGLKKRIADPSRLANWNTAAQYQVNPVEVSIGAPMLDTLTGDAQTNLPLTAISSLVGS
jgi:uncharacterized membrane protein YgdD (TMEM256/DUF423 family)